MPSSQIKQSRRRTGAHVHRGHLRELRQHLFVSAAGVMVMTFVGYQSTKGLRPHHPHRAGQCQGPHPNFGTISLLRYEARGVDLAGSSAVLTVIGCTSSPDFVGPGMTRRRRHTWAYGTALTCSSSSPAPAWGSGY